MNDLGEATLQATTVRRETVAWVVRAPSSPRAAENLPIADWLAHFDAVVDLPLAPSPLVERVLRAPPQLILLRADAAHDDPVGEAVGATPGAPAPHAYAPHALELIRRLKADPTTAIVPVVAVVDGDAAIVLAAGADEALRPDMSAAEILARLDGVIRRSDRDLDVHPSTRLPGARAIDAELRRRLLVGEPFAVGYADLDHFKEYNDRYGYHCGNGVIQLLSKILYDVVKGYCGASGFVGHIGGDDFLFAVPLEAMSRVCDDIITVFDELTPFQYSEQDRTMGYFFGKDRRGQLHRVPLMTLSIGVATSQWRRFTRVSEVSDLATEMKTFAKGQPGSLWAVDRRRDDGPPAATSAGPDAAGGVP